MADFSALCPLFSTGVYNDVKVLHDFAATSRSTTTRWGMPVFGRSVIVTAGYIAKLTTFTATATAVKVGSLPSRFLDGYPYGVCDIELVQFNYYASYP